MDRLLRDTKGRSKNKKQARVSFDPQSLHNTHTASQPVSHYQQQIGPAQLLLVQCACEMNTTQPPTTSQQRGEKQRKSLVYSIPSSKLVIASELNRFPHSFSCHETCMKNSCQYIVHNHQSWVLMIRLIHCFLLLPHRELVYKDFQISEKNIWAL